MLMTVWGGGVLHTTAAFQEEEEEEEGVLCVQGSSVFAERREKWMEVKSV